MTNIVITSAGRRVSLVRYFQHELKASLGSEAKVYTADLKPEMSSACILSDGGFQVGCFSDPDYMEKLKQLCLDNGIGLIVPTIDTELSLLSVHREEFLAEGIHLVVSSNDFVSICRDKRLMNGFFEEQTFKLPAQVDRFKPSFPVFIKPIDGSSSRDLHLIEKPSQLCQDLVEREDLIWMEYLSKEEYDEYTVDMYYDKQSELKCLVPRIRIAVRGGETNKGITVRNRYLMDFLRERLNTITGARGCLTLQVFVGKRNKEIYGIEINPRFGGGYPLSYLAGANYPKMIIEEYLLGNSIDFYDGWQENKLLLRYDSELTVENFDFRS